MQILRIATTTLLVALAAVLLFFSLPFTGWKALSVQTGSMEPAIPQGSLVFVHSVPATSLQGGDTITYKSTTQPGVTITHRIIERKGLDNGPQQFVVKGDANDSADPLIYEHQVVGKVVRSVPYIGKAIDFLKTPLGLALFVYLPAALLAIYEIRLLVRRMSQLEVEKYKAAAVPQSITVAPPTPPVRRKITVIAILLALGSIVTAPTFAALADEVVIKGTVISGQNAPVTVAPTETSPEVLP